MANNKNQKQKQKQKAKKKGQPQQQQQRSTQSVEAALAAIERKRDAANLRAARLQLNVFSRHVGAKWTDDNAARSNAMRTRTFFSPVVNAANPGTMAFAVMPALATMAYVNPSLSGAETINTTWSGTAIDNSAYASLNTEGVFYRVVGFGLRISVTQAALASQGVITLQTHNGYNAAVAGRDGYPATRSAITAGKQTYPFSAGRVIEWNSKPIDNSCREYTTIGGDTRWEKLCVWCTGLSTGATVEVEVRMDIEVIASAGNILNYTATDAAKFNPGILEAVSDYSASMVNSFNVASNTAAAIAAGGTYILGQARQGGQGANPAAAA